MNQYADGFVLSLPILVLFDRLTNNILFASGVGDGSLLFWRVKFFGHALSFPTSRHLFCFVGWLDYYYAMEPLLCMPKNAKTAILLTCNLYYE